MRILRRVPKTKKTFVQMTLHFIAYAKPRLDNRQLREILSTPSTSQHLRPSGIIREDAIARYCSSLLRKSNDGSYFEFAHFSVQEFLTNSILRSSDVGMFYISKPRCNKLLALRCLEYLQLDNFNHLPTATIAELVYMKKRDDEYPLYEYAAKYWLYFAREEWIHPELLAQAKRLFDPRKSTNFTSWAATLVLNMSGIPQLNPSEESFNETAIDLIAKIVHDSFRPLHFAATMSLPEISSFLIQNSRHCETRCMLGTPIECAVKCISGIFEQLPSTGLFDISSSLRLYIGTDVSEISYAVYTVGTFLDMNTRAPDDLLRSSLRAGIRIRNLSVAHLLVHRGLIPTRSDLDCFQRTMNRMTDDGTQLWYGQSLQSLCQFCEALSSGIDDSPLYLEFCQLAWEFCLNLTEKLDNLKGYKISSKVTDDANSLELLALVAIDGPINITALQRVVNDRRVGVSSILSPNQGDGLLHLLVRAEDMIDWYEDIWISHAEEALDLLLSAGCSLSKRNSDGHTPLTLAIQEGMFVSARMILKRCENEPTAWECQTPILVLIAESGSEEILDLLRSMGLEVDVADYEEKTPLHCLGDNTSLTLAKKLESLVPDARQCRSNAKLPWECYMDTILAAGGFNSTPLDVLEYLVQPLVTHSDSSEASKVWEYFASRISQSEDLTFEYIDEAAKCLIRAGIFDSYEKTRSRSALLPIAQACSKKRLINPGSDEDFSLTDATLCLLVNATTYWDSFKESPCAVELLKISATLNYSMALDQLLSRGISVHRRCEGISALEHVCALPATHDDDAFRVRQLLDYADLMYLNHTNPKSGLGLIHLWSEADVSPFRHEIVEMLLGRGASPDLRINTSPYSTALTYHLAWNHSDLAATLLRQGANPTVSCRFGWTATHTAIAFRNVLFLSELLEQRSPLWTIDWEGQCDIVYHSGRYSGARPLHIAALSSFDCLQAILEKITFISLEAPAKNGYTAVHFAVMGGNISAVELLHARGANINARSVDGQLALHIAVNRGNLAVAEKLLELGSEMSPDCNDMTPLLLAFQHNNQKIINCLRAHDVGQPAVVSVCTRSTALAKGVFRAIQAGNLSSCQEILASLPTVDIDIPTMVGGLTALGVAVRLGKLNIMTWLLQQGANANYPCGNDSSIILLTIFQPHLNPGLPAMLERYIATGGSVLRESGCVVATAVRANNEEGLLILLDHLKANMKHHA